MSAESNIGVVFSLGALLLVLGVIIWINTRLFMARAQQVKGSVDHMKYRRDSDGGGYAPVFQFKTLGGESIQVAGIIYSNPPQYKAGQVVDVLYDPKNPQRARINKGSNMYFVPFLLVGCGIVLLIINALGKFP
jgi:Protein of unknown function (DUF3592)